MRTLVIVWFTLAALLAARPAAAENVSLKAPPGILQGTLTVPEGSGPFPVVLIVAGSGPTDRDGNSGPVRTNTYALIAADLQRKGVATLRYDKRGVAGSSLAIGSESELRFSTYVNDAIAWVAWLRKDQRFGHVFIAGHSEGSLVGILAAERTRLDGLISLDGAGRRAPALLHEQIARNAPDLLAESDAIAAQLAHGVTVDDVPPDLEALYRPSVQPYLISWFAYDPAAEIAKVKIPVSIVEGDADIQVPVGDAKLLAAAAPDATLTIVPGMSHTLKHVAGIGKEQEAPAYYDPTLPVEPPVIQSIVNLIARAA